MTIDIPPHEFAAAANTMDDEVVVTPGLQCWAGAVVTALSAAGRRVPEDLALLHAGGTMPRSRWVWLLDEVLRPRERDCPF